MKTPKPYESQNDEERAIELRCRKTGESWTSEFGFYFEQDHKKHGLAIFDAAGVNRVPFSLIPSRSTYHKNMLLEKLANGFYQHLDNPSEMTPIVRSYQAK